MSYTQYTQVISVQPSTVSGLHILDSSEVSFGSSEPLPEGSLHKVDNGIAYQYQGTFTDFSFNAIPDTFKPRISQSMFQWRVDLLSNGITNSYVGADKAAYLKTLVKAEGGQSRLSYSPAWKFLRPNTIPWALYTDLPAANFKAFDSVKLYQAMASRGFAFGRYAVDYLNSAGSLCEEFGNFAAIPLRAVDLSPAHFLGNNNYYVNKVIQPNEVTALFWPGFWVQQETSNASGVISAASPLPSLDSFQPSGVSVRPNSFYSSVFGNTAAASGVPF